MGHIKHTGEHKETAGPAAGKKPVKSITWQDSRLYLLDQTRLPLETAVEEYTTAEQVWDAVKQLKVRGAPAIGVAAAYGLVLGMRDCGHLSREAYLHELKRKAAYLDSSRPTAVNLHWALQRVVKAVEALESRPTADLAAALVREAELIHAEDIALCRSIGEHGAQLISEGAGILTHCNAGRLATSDYGTATAPMYLARERGVRFTVYSDETRPLLQGSRLTAWELMEAGIDVVTITDSMAASLMQEGRIDLVIVGTDRVAANGDIANKIGTLGVAIAADYFAIPMYIASPASTIDLATPTGADIIIEERDPAEVTSFGLRRTAPQGVRVRNPAFDVTPHSLITGIITDRGIVRPPYDENLRRLFS
jgi:methylthioribose-1-phosphate isomerase